MVNLVWFPVAWVPPCVVLVIESKNALAALRVVFSHRVQDHFSIFVSVGVPMGAG
jgi:hypothetical protein